MTHGPASAPGYPHWRETRRSIAAAPVIATGLRVSPLLTPLRLDSADGCVGKKRVRQDTVHMTKEH